MDNNASTSTSLSDSGIHNPFKRRKLEKDTNNTKQAIINKMLDEVATFGAPISRILIAPKKTEDNYRGLFRLYKAAVKALELLEIERLGLEYELEPLPAHADKVLRSSDDNVVVWSQYFNENPPPAKIKGVKTIPSQVKQRIGRLLQSIASFVGLTAEAVCLNKQKKEHIDNINHLLEVTKITIETMKRHRDVIVEELHPFMEEKQVNQSTNRGASNQNVQINESND